MSDGWTAKNYTINLKFLNSVYPLSAERRGKIEKEKNLTLLWIVKCTPSRGMPRQQKVVSDYERGRTSPTKERLPLIAKFFGITIDDLLDLKNDKNLLNSNLKTIHGKKSTAKVTELYDLLTPEEQRVVLRQIRGLIAERKNGTPLHR